MTRGRTSSGSTTPASSSRRRCRAGTGPRSRSRRASTSSSRRAPRVEATRVRSPRCRLLQIVLELTDLPVVAAGGIASGRGLAAVLAAGAVGAWVGTPFLLAEEARNSAAARERIARSDETETLYTSVYDRLQDKGWPAEFRARAIRNAFGARWTGHEDELGAGTKPREEFVRGARGPGLRRRAHLRRAVDRHARRRPARRSDRRGHRGPGARAARPLVAGRPGQRRSAALTAAPYPSR